MSDAPTTIPAGDVEAAQHLHAACQQLGKEISRVVVGQHAVVKEVLIALLARGHCLLQGVPGLAKTLLASSFAEALDLSFARLQFTPDLMPSDITGTDILQESPETRRRAFEFQPGPIFANLVLADEINRAPPKTQSALLQAMQERQVTAGARTLQLPDPFFVIATQNPIEQEGTYPLPEAQLDRFMFMVHVDYPAREDEALVLRQTTGTPVPRLSRVLNGEQLRMLQGVVRRVPVGDHVFDYVLSIVRATRPQAPEASDFVRHWLNWGAGPRAGQFMILAAKARALLEGRLYATTDDVRAVAAPVLRHRIVPNFNADAEGVTAEQIIARILTLAQPLPGERLL